MPLSFYPEGATILVGDDVLRSVHKLVATAMSGVPGPPGPPGGGANSTVGSGSPNGAVSGNPGDKYLDGDVDAIWTKKTGVGTNTGWV
jgi:hypothetical protein